MRSSGRVVIGSKVGLFSMDEQGGSVEECVFSKGHIGGLAIDSSAEELYVSDTSAHRILVLQNDGSIVRTLELGRVRLGLRPQPCGLLFDAETKELLVVERVGGLVHVLQRDGKLLRTFGQPSAQGGGLTTPQGIARAPDGTIFVTDKHTVQV